MPHFPGSNSSWAQCVRFWATSRSARASPRSLWRSSPRRPSPGLESARARTNPPPSSPRGRS
eukprot:8545688-Pyramimonas_sp.AAC.1